MNLTTNDFYITNTIKCPREDSNDPPKNWHLANCKKFLNREKEIQQPRIIIGLGGSAKYEMGFSEWGKIREIDGIIEIVIWHPGYVNRCKGKFMTEWFNQVESLKAYL